MHRLVLIAVCSVSSSSYANLYVQPNLTSSFGYNIAENYATEQRIAVGTKLEYSTEQLSFTFDGRLEHDFVYSDNERFSIAAEDQYGSRAIIEEAYVSGELGLSFWSFGYQKVVWGEADDLRIVDVINPLDFKSFILFDIDDYRVAVPMLKVDYEYDNGDTLNFITTIEQRSNEYPASGAEFGNNYYPNSESSEWGKYELGLRYNMFVHDTDISLYAFHGYQDDPVLNATANERPDYSYEKFSMIGTSLSKPIDAFVLRTELAYFDNYTVNDSALQHKDVNKLEALVGLDYRYKDWTTTVQYTNQLLNGWQPTYMIPESAPIYTASAERGLFANQVYLRAALSYVDNQGGGLLSQLKLTYKPNQYWLLKLNLDLIDGEQANYLGAQQQRDRIWLAATYYF